MAIFDLFSKRQKRLRGDCPDVYVYDELPSTLRVQIVHIVKDAIGQDNYGWEEASETYDFINNSLCREYGVFKLTDYAKNSAEAIFNYFLKESDTEKALDFVELSFKIINSYIADNPDYQNKTTTKITPQDAVDELNGRFRESGVGYQFESGELIRVDSEFLHAEAVKPTLSLLRQPEFNGANEEFLAAHEHYRHGRYKECLVDTLKCFESTIKTIGNLQGWLIPAGASAKNLIALCFEKEILPKYLETQFSSMRSLLESGVPTIRSKNGGHGQGPDPIVVPQHLARYALNLTATTVLFLIESYQAIR